MSEFKVGEKVYYNKEIYIIEEIMYDDIYCNYKYKLMNNKKNICFVVVEGKYIKKVHPREQEFEPRKYEFEAWMSENPNNRMRFGDSNCPLTNAFGYETSFFYERWKDADAFNKRSKWKITMEEVVDE